MTTFGVLGPLSAAADDGGGSALSGRASRRLLASLLAHPNQVVSPSRLADAIWDNMPAAPGAALHTLVWRLRHALGKSGRERIETASYGYLLRVGTEQLDSLLFQDLVAKARAAASQDPTRALGLWDSALALWRGPAFGDVHDVLLVQPEATRLDELRLTAVEDRAELLVERGRHVEAVVALEAHVEQHPLRERPLTLLMRALYGVGRHPEALHVAAAYRHRLARELGLDPSPQLQLLEKRILRHEVEVAQTEPRVTERWPREAAPGGAVSTEAPVMPKFGRPPLPRSTFVGRERDVRAVTELLRQGAVVTLIGVGGIGKTRLALEVARVAEEWYPDGILYCGLAEVVDEDGFLHVLAQAAGLLSDVVGSLRERLVDGLAIRRSLLMLDGCEHLLGPVAQLVGEVVSCSETLAVLTTSRARLGVEGEHLWPVSPLEVPTDGQDENAASVRLLIDRARAVVPHFGSSPEARREAVELCRRLDGLPLAIELAAARLRGRTLSEIISSLDRGTEFLPLPAGGLGAAKPHRSLREVVDWSYQLLEPEDRALFDQLAAFPGGFDIEAVCAVADVGSSVEELRHGLLRLVEASLVEHRQVDQSSRYHLLDTLRRYGVQNLRTNDTLPQVEMRHARWYVEVARRVDQDRAMLKRWVDVFEQELGNLRAARRNLARRNDVEALLAFSSAMHWYGYYSMRPEIFEWAEDSIRRAPDVETPEYGAVLGTVALGAWLRGDVQQAGDAARRAVAICASQDDPRATNGLDVLGDIAMLEGRHREAARLYARECALSGSAGDRYEFAMHLGCQAVARAAAGDIDVARAIVADAEKTLVRASGRDMRAMMALVEGQIALHAGDRAAARTHFWRAVNLAEDSANRYVTSVAWMAAAKIEAVVGEPRSSALLYLAMLHHWPRNDAEIPLAVALRGVVELLRGIGWSREAALVSGGVPPTPDSLIFAGLSDRFADTRNALRAELGEAEFRRVDDAGRDMSRSELLAYVGGILEHLGRNEKASP